jgi:predicted dehydrogenase
VTAAEPVAVGVVGAGPWARFVHAPLFAGHPRTRLAGVWARRPEAAAEVAADHGAPAFTSFDELLAVCDAVSFAVPPDVQAEMAMTAARAGKALLLEKPIALDLDHARLLADAVDAAGVPTMVFLTWRYTAAGRAFLDTVATAVAAGSTVVGGRGRFISGGFLGGPFATPWRLEHGPLLDLGPHVVDMLDAALGRVVGIRGHGDPRRWVGLLLEHESGVASEVSLSGHVNVEPFRAGVDVYTAEGAIDFDAVAGVTPDTMVTIAGELADLATGVTDAHPLDVHRGLHLQQLLQGALADIRR